MSHCSFALRDRIHPKQKRHPNANASPTNIIHISLSSHTTHGTSSSYMSVLTWSPLVLDCPADISPASSNPPLYAKSKPKPFMQLLYLPTKSMHASWGSFDVENSMHSSRAAFSSLHTQQGLGFDVAASIVVAGLFEAARLLMRRESEAVEMGC